MPLASAALTSTGTLAPYQPPATGAEAVTEGFVLSTMTTKVVAPELPTTSAAMAVKVTGPACTLEMSQVAFTWLVVLPGSATPVRPGAETVRDFTPQSS